MKISDYLDKIQTYAYSMNFTKMIGSR